jgi:hypothetical protein
VFPLSREILDCELGRLRVNQCIMGAQNSLDLMAALAANEDELDDELNEFGDDSVEFAASFFRILGFLELHGSGSPWIRGDVAALLMSEFLACSVDEVVLEIGPIWGRSQCWLSAQLVTMMVDCSSLGYCSGGLELGQHRLELK